MRTPSFVVENSLILFFATLRHERFRVRAVAGCEREGGVRATAGVLREHPGEVHAHPLFSLQVARDYGTVIVSCYLLASRKNHLPFVISLESGMCRATYA